MANNKHININNTPYHLWYGNDNEEALRRYYRIAGNAFLCPDCRTITHSSFEDFKAQHLNASAFLVNKKKLLQLIRSGDASSINRAHQLSSSIPTTTMQDGDASQSSPTPIEQAPPPPSLKSGGGAQPTLKRQRGGSAPYHFDRVAPALQRCHIGVHLTIDNESTTSIASFIEQHGDAILQRLIPHLQHLSTYKVQLTSFVEYRRTINRAHESSSST